MIPLGILASTIRTVLPDELLVPTNLDASLVGGLVKLTWTDNNTDETGHRIYRSSSPMDTQSLPPPVDELGPNVTEWEDTDTPVDQVVYYIVSAVRSTEEAFSDEVMIDLRETTYDVFTSSGNYLVPEGVTEVDVLIVAGGGGGGSRQGGGGGAGGLQIVTVPVTPLSNIPVIVGLGGQGGTSGGRGLNGGNSSFGSITSIGGGGGGGRTSNNAGSPGGSGGGGAGNGTGGSGVPGQGHAGGRANNNAIITNLGGGGGGAGHAGSSPVPLGASTPYQSDAGSGGDGIFIPELIQYGDAGWFAGGGGGSGFNTKSPDGGGEGGRGGGGKGHGSGKDAPVSPPGPGESGLPNTGGGGGGSSSGDFSGGSGGSGVVIVMSPGGRIPPTLNSKRAITVSK